MKFWCNEPLQYCRPVTNFRPNATNEKVALPEHVQDTFFLRGGGIFYSSVSLLKIVTRKKRIGGTLPIY